MVIQFKDVIHHDVLLDDPLLHGLQFIHVVIRDFLVIIDVPPLQLVNNDFLLLPNALKLIFKVILNESHLFRYVINLIILIVYQYVLLLNL